MTPKSIAALKFNKTLNNCITFMNIAAFIDILFFEHLRPLTTGADAFLIFFTASDYPEPT